MENNHTKGEWAVDGFNLHAVICKDEKGRWKKIADTTQETSYELEEEKANAKLIVKAVNNHEKLVKALKRVYDVTCIHSGTKVFSDAFANELKELLQSIEKQ